LGAAGCGLQVAGCEFGLTGILPLHYPVPRNPKCATPNIFLPVIQEAGDFE